MKRLDLYDKKLLHHLNRNSRGAYSHFSKLVKLPKTTVRYRIDKLITDGYLHNCYALVNKSTFGYRYYATFLEYNLMDVDEEAKLVNYIKNHASTMMYYQVQGKYAFVFVSTHRNTGAYFKFFREFMERFGEYIVHKTVQRIARLMFTHSNLFHGDDIQSVRVRLIDTPRIKVDALDLKILELLQEDSRVRIVDIATHCGVEKTKALYRLRRLEKNDVIVKYTTRYNIAKVSYFSQLLLISIKKISAVKNIIAFFTEYGHCDFAFRIIGEYDLMLQVYAKDPAEFRLLIKNFRSTFSAAYLDLVVLQLI
jgi:DNA-binding Lrp family transcriptional regulator